MPSVPVGSEKSEKGRTLNLASCNPYIMNFKAMEYAARGPVIIRAMEIETDLRNGVEKPFKQVIKANLGDAQAMGQPPITFIRQLLSLITCPNLMEDSNFPEDVKVRARNFLQQCRGNSIGSYSESRGMQIVRSSISSYISQRDGIPSTIEDIVISAGASDAIRACLRLFKSPEGMDEQSGVLIPVPEYPLYSATLAEYNIKRVDYYLDESQDWNLNLEDLKNIVNSMKGECDLRAIVVINPGNPTGHVLPRGHIEEIIRFAYDHNLVLLADEVYQHNVYGEAEFVSFRKALLEMPSPYNRVELASFFSCSKGYACECGLRGGFVDFVNLDRDVKSSLVATAANKLCPTVIGQALVECVVNPPKPGDESYPQFVTERDNILGSLEKRAQYITEGFNSIPGISCSTVNGAMYAYPKLELPKEAIRAAERKGVEPDVFYALALLEETGICVVPGSGVGQAPGTHHFRTTILPDIEQLKEMINKFKDFHLKFLKAYSGI